MNPDEASKGALAALFASHEGPVSQGMMSVTYLVARILSSFVWQGSSDGSNSSAHTGLTMAIKSQGLPIGAGLGSSASFSVAVAASCLRLQALLFLAAAANGEVDATSSISLQRASCALLGTAADSTHAPSTQMQGVVNGWAFASEILLHGSPSGLDNTTSCYGGLVKFSRKGGEKFENITGVPALHILLVNTRVPRSTKQLVAGVRVLHDAYPQAVGPMLESIDAIALTFLDLVSK